MYAFFDNYMVFHEFYQNGMCCYSMRRNSLLNGNKIFEMAYSSFSRLQVWLLSKWNYNRLFIISIVNLELL